MAAFFWLHHPSDCTYLNGGPSYNKFISSIADSAWESWLNTTSRGGNIWILISGNVSDPLETDGLPSKLGILVQRVQLNSPLSLQLILHTKSRLWILDCRVISIIEILLQVSLYICVRKQEEIDVVSHADDATLKRWQVGYIVIIRLLFEGVFRTSRYPQIRGNIKVIYQFTMCLV